jgi:hypothetical protein
MRDLMNRVVPIRTPQLLVVLVLLTLGLAFFSATSAQAATLDFEAKSYPATVHGSGEVGVFVMNAGGEIKCKNAFHGTLNGPSTTLKLSATYAECTAWGFLNATVHPEGCVFVMHSTEEVKADEYKAHLSLECPAGKSLKVSVLNCAAEYKSQTGLTTVKINNNTAATPDDITIYPEVKGVAYTVTKDGFVCPLSGTGNFTNGEITTPKEGAGGVTLTGQTGGGASIDFTVGGNPVHHAETTTHEAATKLRKEVEASEHALSTTTPSPPLFTAAKYPATIHGSSAKGTLKLGTEGGSLECENGFHGSLASASSTLNLAVTYSSCTAFGLGAATVTAEGCEYRLHSTQATAKDQYAAHMGIKCPLDKSLKIQAGTCKVELKEQTGKTSVKLTDVTTASPVEDVKIKPEATGISYTVTEDGAGCPFAGTGAKTNGSLTGTAPITLTGQNPSIPSEKIGVRVGAHSDKTHFEATEHEAATKLREEVQKSEHALSTSFPAASQFTAGKYPAIVHGSSTKGTLKLSTEGGSVECANTYFAEATKGSSTLDVVALFESCSAFGSAATVNPEGCGFRLHGVAPTAKDEYSGRLGIKCEVGESIKITTAACSVELKEQGPLSSVKLIDDTAAAPVENVTLKPEVKGIKYTVTEDGVGCPFNGTGTKTTGELTSAANVTLTAQSPSTPSEKIAFRIGEPSDKVHFEETEETHTTETHVARFQTPSYPAEVHGSGSLGLFTFVTNGGTIECQNTFKGTLMEAATTLKLAVTYAECTAFGFFNATVTPEGCQSVLHNPKFAATDKYEASISLECPAGQSIKVSVLNCAAEFKSQTGLKPIWLYDDTSASPFEDVTFEPAVPTGVKYTVTKDGFGCPLTSTGEFSDGKLTAPKGPVTLTGKGTAFKVG